MENISQQQSNQAHCSFTFVHFQRVIFPFNINRVKKKNILFNENKRKRPAPLTGIAYPLYDLAPYTLIHLAPDIQIPSGPPYSCSHILQDGSTQTVDESEGLPVLYRGKPVDDERINFAIAEIK